MYFKLSGKAFPLKKVFGAHVLGGIKARESGKGETM